MEKSRRNAEEESWLGAWQEVLHQDEWRSCLYYCVLHLKITSDFCKHNCKHKLKFYGLAWAQFVVIVDTIITEF